MVRDRNAMEILCFGFLAASVFQTAFFLQPLPPSLAQAPLLGHIASLSLFIGCLGSIIGILWPDHDRSLLIEQGFIPFAGFGCLTYAVALSQANPFASAAFAFGMSVGIGVFCIWRFLQVQRYVRHRRDLGERTASGEDP
jgi:hypothetical protein